MSYYDTLDEDLARAKTIIASETIYGKDVFAALRLLESFVEAIETFGGTRAPHEQARATLEELSAVDDIGDAILQAAGSSDPTIQIRPRDCLLWIFWTRLREPGFAPKFPFTLHDLKDLDPAIVERIDAVFEQSAVQRAKRGGVALPSTPKGEPTK